MWMELRCTQASLTTQRDTYLSTLDGPHPPQGVLGYKGTVKNKKEQHYFLALALAGLYPLEQHTQELQHLEQRRNEYS